MESLSPAQLDSSPSSYRGSRAESGDEQSLHTALKIEPEEFDLMNPGQEIYGHEGNHGVPAENVLQMESTCDDYIKRETVDDGSEYGRGSSLQVSESFIEGVNLNTHCEISEKPCRGIGKSSKIPEKRKGIHTGPKSYSYRPHSCSDCGKNFRQLRTLKQHQFIHSGEKPLCCTECDKTFNHLRSLIRHQLIHTGEKPHCCSECGKSFRQFGGLKRHQLIHTGERQYSCTQCGKRFSRLESLKTHHRMHTGEKPYSCMECNKNFSHLASLKSHQRIHCRQQHFSGIECKNTTLNSEENLLLCRDKLCHCTVCGESFSQLPTLKAHQLFCHRQKQYSCTECGRSLTNLGSLKLHQRIHTGEKPHSCADCGKSFRQLGTLKRHQLVHTEEKQHCCTICGKTFTLKAGLKAHQRNHTIENVYADGGKSTNHMRNIKIHRRTQMGERPYSCSDCGKSFCHLGNLKKHQLIHTDKSYSCIVCGKTFCRLANLEQHRLFHTGEKLYSCNECGSVNLQLTRTGETPRSCNGCGNGFKNNESFDIHDFILAGKDPPSSTEFGKRFAGSLQIPQNIRKGGSMYTDREGGQRVCQLGEFKEQRIQKFEKPYTCTNCGDTFSNMGHFKQHQQTHIKEKRQIF